MPEGWMVNAKTGEPLTDPAHSAEGMLMPIGGYKGSGLAIMLGLLGGRAERRRVRPRRGRLQRRRRERDQHRPFHLALDVTRFIPLAAFNAEVDRHMRDLHASKRLPGFDAIRLPGERRRAMPRRATARRRAAARGAGRRSSTSWRMRWA